MVILRYEDCRALGFCERGIRFVVESHGLDWLSFLEKGVDVDTLKHVEDTNVKRAIAHAIERTSKLSSGDSE